MACSYAKGAYLTYIHNVTERATRSRRRASITAAAASRAGTFWAAISTALVGPRSRPPPRGASHSGYRNMAPASAKAGVGRKRGAPSPKAASRKRSAAAAAAADGADSESSSEWRDESSADDSADANDADWASSAAGSAAPSTALSWPRRVGAIAAVQAATKAVLRS